MPQTSSVLVMTDSDTAVAEVLGRAGFNITSVSERAQALELLGNDRFDVAVVDFDQSSGGSVEIIRFLREFAPETQVIVVSSQPNVKAVITCLRERTYDFLCLPEDIERLALTARRAVEERHRKQAGSGSNGRGRSSRNDRGRAHRPVERSAALSSVLSSVLIGNAPALDSARSMIAEVAPSDMTVLIRGESGTGKDVVARLVHEISDRKNRGAFVKVNCPAIPETLFESELFGYEKGAFTGAVRQKPGRFELADHGTIFLDEIGTLSLGMQAKLLEVIEHKQFTRVGGNQTINVDARIVTATNASIEEMIATGEFRADLFYRLKQFTIALPALRRRREDIPLLAHHFLHVYGTKYGMSDLVLPAHVMPQFLEWDWPGNVRELEAVIARYALSGDVSALETALVGEDAPTLVPVDDLETRSDDAPRVDRLDEVESATILAALNSTRWNRRKAAQELGISYSALRRRMAKYNLNDDPARQGSQP